MTKIRRLAAVALTIAGLTAGATPAAAAPGKAKGPQPVTELLRAVDAHHDGWVTVWFKTDRDVCDLRLRAYDSDLVEVHHPAGRSYTSLNQNSSLGKHEIDYATFRVNADVDSDQWIPVNAKITWTFCGADDKMQVRKTTFVLPVQA